MEIEKIIRIVATAIAAAAFAVWITMILFFPEAPLFSYIPQSIVLLFCLWRIWRGRGQNQDAKSN